MKIKKFVADVTNNPNISSTYKFLGGGEVSVELDSHDQTLPIQLHINGYYFNPTELRKLAKILNKTADAVEEYFQTKE